MGSKGSCGMQENTLNEIQVSPPRLPFFSEVHCLVLFISVYANQTTCKYTHIGYSVAHEVPLENNLLRTAPDRQTTYHLIQASASLHMHRHIKVLLDCHNQQTRTTVESRLQLHGEKTKIHHQAMCNNHQLLFISVCSCWLGQCTNTDRLRDGQL